MWKYQNSNSTTSYIIVTVVIIIDMTHVDLIVMQRSCSSFRVSVNLVSPARDEAMMPALLTRESVSVDLPWSTCAITDMFLMFFFLSMISRISSIVKFTYNAIRNNILLQHSQSMQW